MGGYNTFCEILSFDKRALIVPRTVPRLEQYIRAARGRGARPLPRAGRGRGRGSPGRWRRRCAICRSSSCPPRSSCPGCSTAWTMSTGWWTNGSPAAAGRSSLWLAAAPVANLADHERSAGRVGRAAARRCSSSRAIRGCPRPSSPRRSAALEQRGLDIRIVSLRHPTDRKTHPITGEIRAPRRSICRNISIASRGACWRGWRRARRLPGYRRGAQRLARRSPARSDAQPRPALRPGAGAGGRAAGRASRGCTPISCTRPASVARYAALMTRPALERLGPCQGHLDDARLGEAREARRLRLAGDLHRGRRRPSARARRRRPSKVTLVHHGLDLARFPAAASARDRCATAAMPAIRSSSSPSAGRWRRRAMTICSPRWRCCRRILPGASSISAAGRCCPTLKAPGRAPRPRRPHRLARRADRRPRCWRPSARADLFVLASRDRRATATATACPMC